MSKDPFDRGGYKFPDPADPEVWRTTVADLPEEQVPINIGAHQHEMCRCIAILLEADKIKGNPDLMRQIRQFLRAKREEAEALLDKVN